MQLWEYTLCELRRLLDDKAFSARELTQAYLERLQATNSTVNAYISQCADSALEQADHADRLIAAGQAQPLTGIPLGLKDIFVTQDVLTTCASRMLENFVPPYDGTAVQRLKEQGMVLLGKLNMDEFAMGSSNENSAFGPVRNPWNLDCVPGGSSGGSAAAVAARQAVATLGTDTGGSIRQPASHCGVVGLKPTYGRVSRYGIVAFASSLDQVGPLTRDVADAACLLQAVAGHDPQDATSVPQPVPDYSAALQQDVAGLRIGLPQEAFGEGLDPEVRQAVEAAVAQYQAAGATVKEVSLPHSPYAVACYYLIATAEASSNLARYDGVRYGLRSGDPQQGLLDMYRQSRSQGFGDEVQRRILLGTYALSAGYYDAYYRKAQQVRRLIHDDFQAAFSEVDLLLQPVTPTPAFALGDKLDDPLQMYLCDIYTLPVNLAGNCGMSVPCGFSEAGLPIGLQLIGPAFGEETLLRAGYAYQQWTDWHRRQAPEPAAGKQEG